MRKAACSLFAHPALQMWKPSCTVMMCDTLVVRAHAPRLTNPRARLHQPLTRATCVRDLCVGVRADQAWRSLSSFRWTSNGATSPFFFQGAPTNPPTASRSLEAAAQHGGGLAHVVDGVGGPAELPTPAQQHGRPSRHLSPREVRLDRRSVTGGLRACDNVITRDITFANRIGPLSAIVIL